MKLIKNIRGAATLLALLTLLLGGVYPLLVAATSQILFSYKAGGSLITRGETVVGSALLGQAFSSPRYFWSRPSAQNYDPMISGGTNWAPGHPEHISAMHARVAHLRKAQHGHKGRIPADMVMASGSGLDPHISTAAARYQAPRVAKARGLKEKDIEKLITTHEQGLMLRRTYVSVLALNLALDDMAKETPKKKKGE